MFGGNMSSIKLSKRLESIKKHIPHSGGVIDVGTDHGYIPISLTLDDHEGRIVASDLKPRPLDNAKQAAISSGAADKIEFVLCDGLSGVNPEGIKTVVIAGMGGETISHILAAAPWTKADGRLLILQPMTKSTILRKWLFDNGYRVLTEELCENGALYEIMTVKAGKDLPYSPTEYILGHYNLICTDPLFPRRVDELINKTKKSLTGLSRSTKAEDKKRLKTESDILTELLKIMRCNYG